MILVWSAESSTVISPLVRVWPGGGAAAARMLQRGNIDFDQVRMAARQGAGSKFQMFGGGTPVAGHAAVYDASGNVVDGGGASGVLGIRTVAVNTTMTAADYTVVATAASITITLPAAPLTGQIVNVKNGNSTVGMLITVSSGSSVLIDQAATLSLGATSSLMVQWDGTQWRIL